MYPPEDEISLRTQRTMTRSARICGLILVCFGWLVLWILVQRAFFNTEVFPKIVHHWVVITASVVVSTYVTSFVDQRIIRNKERQLLRESIVLCELGPTKEVREAAIVARIIKKWQEYICTYLIVVFFVVVPLAFIVQLFALSGDPSRGVAVAGFGIIAGILIASTRLIVRKPPRFWHAPEEC